MPRTRASGKRKTVEEVAEQPKNMIADPAESIGTDVLATDKKDLNIPAVISDNEALNKIMLNDVQKQLAVKYAPDKVAMYKKYLQAVMTTKDKTIKKQYLAKLADCHKNIMEIINYVRDRNQLEG